MDWIDPVAFYRSGAGRARENDGSFVGMSRL
jgi:hypothetical protein